MHLDLGRDPRRTFPDVVDHEAVGSARIWHCKFRSLAPVRTLRNLHTLEIATYPDGDLEPIGTLVALRWLRILHLPRVTSLGPLAALARLETLSLETLPSWDASGRRTRVDSLEPLTRLPALAHLQLLGVVPEAGGLAPLERCAALRTARLSNHDRAELARFRAASTAEDDFAPQPTFDPEPAQTR